MDCRCPFSEPCTCGAGVPEYGELPAPLPTIPLGERPEEKRGDRP